MWSIEASTLVSPTAILTSAPTFALSALLPPPSRLVMASLSRIVAVVPATATIAPSNSSVPTVTCRHLM